MKMDTEKIDEGVLALLHLTSFEFGDSLRSWKGYDWEALHRLHEKGMIGDPRGKAKSVVFSEEGAMRAKEGSRNCSRSRMNSNG